jgi:hypothetical protein
VNVAAIMAASFAGFAKRTTFRYAELPITSAIRLSAKAGWHTSTDKSSAHAMVPTARIENPQIKKRRV